MQGREIDGEMGPRTAAEAAVLTFQEQAGMTADGKLGPRPSRRSRRQSPTAPPAPPPVRSRPSPPRPRRRRGTRAAGPAVARSPPTRHMPQPLACRCGTKSFRVTRFAIDDGLSPGTVSVLLHGDADALVPRRRARRRPWARSLSLAVAALCFGVSAAPAPAAPGSSTPECRAGRAAKQALGRPTRTLAWRAVLTQRTPVRADIDRRPRQAVRPADADALLVLGAARDKRGRCWLRVRLPSRPNYAKGWIWAARVHLRSTRWRLVVSRATRRIEIRRAGKPVRRWKVVVGAPATPTPAGLFSIVQVWPWHAGDFLGSWILPLTAHSDVLQEFGSGDGRIGLHGRGGASLLDPLGSAASHGCVRLPNRSIAWIVRRIGAGGLPGVPVDVR